MEKKELEWMPFYVKKFLDGTNHMDAAEIGGYVLLILEQWKKGPLKPDTTSLKRIARVSNKQLSRILEKFKTNDKGFFVNDVCEKVKVEQLDKYAKRAEKAKSAAEKKWSKKRAQGMLQASPEHPTSNAHAMQIKDYTLKSIDKNFFSGENEMPIAICNEYCRNCENDEVWLMQMKNELGLSLINSWDIYVDVVESFKLFITENFYKHDIPVMIDSLNHFKTCCKKNHQAQQIKNRQLTQKHKK